MNLRHWLGVLRVRWRFLTLVTVLGLVWTGFLMVTTSPVYSSSTTVFVSTPPSAVRNAYAAVLATQQRTQSYVQLVDDAAVLERAADELDDVTAAELRDAVSASAEPQSQMLVIEAEADSPEQARDIAQAVSDEVLTTIRTLEDPSDGTIPDTIVVGLVAQASIDRTPVDPNLPIGIPSGVLISLMVGLAATVVREVLDTAARSKAEIERVTGVAAMTVVPEFARAADLLPGKDGAGPEGDAFRLLRTNLQFADVDRTRRLVLVTSAVAGEGKSVVATRLALSLARAGRSVLLLEADLRTPTIAPALGLDDAPGLVSVLLGEVSLDEAISRHRSGIHVLGPGALPPNPAEVLDTEAMREVLAQVRERYDIVLIDAPALLPVADPSILLRQVDGALLVIRYGTTTRDQLHQAATQVQSAGGTLLGTVINRASGRGSGDGYGYGYGYGYGEPGATGRRARTDAP